jgi:hypothetical protein
MNNDWTISQTRVIRRPPRLCPSGDDERRTSLILNISAFELNVDRSFSEYQAYGISKREIPVEKRFYRFQEPTGCLADRLPCGAIQITTFDGMVHTFSLN